MNIASIVKFNRGGMGKTSLQSLLLSLIHGYNHEKYWRRRRIVVDPTNKIPMWLKIYYLYWIKRVDAKHHCSFGTNLNAGSQFITAPYLPHGPYGIIVWNDTELGEGVILYPMTTIPGGL